MSLSLLHDELWTCTRTGGIWWYSAMLIHSHHRVLVCVCIFGFVRSHPPHISCIWSWVVLFSPLPFWFSHIGLYRSRFIHTIRFFYLSLSVLPFHSIFRSFLHHFSWLRLFSSALFLRPRVNLCAENSWFLPLDKFLMICGHTIYTLTHWRRYIKWNKLAKALFIIAFFPFAFKNRLAIAPPYLDCFVWLANTIKTSCQIE